MKEKIERIHLILILLSILYFNNLFFLLQNLFVYIVFKIRFKFNLRPNDYIYIILLNLLAIFVLLSNLDYIRMMIDSINKTNLGLLMITIILLFYNYKYYSKNKEKNINLKYELIKTSMSVFFEEFMFRFVAFQMNSSIITIIVSSFIFSLYHSNNPRYITRYRINDYVYLLIVSIFIGTYYYITFDFFGAFLIHILHNIFIIYDNISKVKNIQEFDW
jgi:hypothetical protein